MHSSRFVLTALAINLGVITFTGAPALAASPNAPTVSEAEVVTVGATTATVTAEIYPGQETTVYQAEYTELTQFRARAWAGATKVPLPGGELPAGTVPISVRVEVQGLQPESTYRLRFVATNTLGTASGPEVTFTTIATANGSSALPDQRVYELVSPSDEGEPYLPPDPEDSGVTAPGFKAFLPFRVAANGDAVAWVGEPAASVGNGETGPGLGNDWLSTRTPTGWSSDDISLAGNDEAAYQAFSTNLTSAVVEGPMSLTGQVQNECGTSVLYSRSAETGAFGALFSPNNCGKPLFAGATENESQIIFQDEAALTSDAREAIEVPPGHDGEHHAPEEFGHPCMFGCNLYDLDSGQLHLVNVLPGGETVPNATFGGYAGEHELTTFSHAISNDGSRIFWTDTQAEREGKPNPEMGHVYVRENGTQTIPVSKGAAEYWTATPDGHYAYYTEGGALWRFNTEVQAGHEANEELVPGAAQVQGVIGVNETGEDGSYVYFVANGVLSTTANEHGETAGAGDCPETGGTGCNLYLLHGNTTTFIATLAPQDDNIHTFSGGGEEASGDWVANVGEHIAQLTADGRHLLFQSHRPLTGYDNDYEGRPQLEAYVYSAESGQLACASCNPTGAPPVIQRGTEGGSEGSLLPESTEDADTYVPQLISEDGNRIFFDTSQALVSQDTNGVQDVYEWEREGEGTCGPRVPARPNAGCVDLLSGGASSVDSFLVGADATGENVFFEHLGSLGQVEAPIDHNELYDARRNGGFATVSEACTGTGCQGVPPVPPIFSTPASVTFSGTGNFQVLGPKTVAKPVTRRQRLAKAREACKRDRKKRRRDSCERQARAKYGAEEGHKPADNAKRISGGRGARS